MPPETGSIRSFGVRPTFALSGDPLATCASALAAAASSLPFGSSRPDAMIAPLIWSGVRFG